MNTSCTPARWNFKLRSALIIIRLYRTSLVLLVVLVLTKAVLDVLRTAYNCTAYALRILQFCDRHSIRLDERFTGATVVPGVRRIMHVCILIDLHSYINIYTEYICEVFCESFEVWITHKKKVQVPE